MLDFDWLIYKHCRAVGCIENIYQITKCFSHLFDGKRSWKAKIAFVDGLVVSDSASHEGGWPGLTKDHHKMLQTASMLVTKALG